MLLKGQLYISTSGIHLSFDLSVPTSKNLYSRSICTHTQQCMYKYDYWCAVWHQKLKEACMCLSKEQVSLPLDGLLYSLFKKFLFFGCVACGILFPRPGMEPTPLAMEAQSFNHWTAREVPLQPFKTNVVIIELRKWIRRCSLYDSFFFLIYLFIYGCVGPLFLCEGFLQLRRAGATLHHGARASHCRGLSCCGAHAPDAQTQ